MLAGDEAALDRWRGEAPVIVLGRAEADPVDRVRAFRRGCDDYVPRPFHYDELVARIHAVLRRTQRPAEMLVAGPLEIDAAHARRRRRRASRSPLSQKEYDLLAPPRRRPAARLHEGGAAARRLGLPRAASRTRTLDSHVSRLRRKLRALDPETPLRRERLGRGLPAARRSPPGDDRNGGLPMRD